MGSGIAAHLANLGFQVTLLDLTEETVQAAFERAKKARPPHFYVPRIADRVRLGSIEKDLDAVSEADWVCEAIVENADAKRELYAEIEPLVRDDAFLSTNTSGLEIGRLAEGRSESFRRRFVGTHFFNPPRYLKLLELIPTPETDPDELARLTAFLEERVGRRVVIAKDTPGFIANRFGMWSMIHAIHVAERLQLDIEAVDAITGPFLGRPRSASFRLNDLVGLDIMRDIARNLYERCPHDPRRETLQLPRSMRFLLEKGWIGEKVGQGYYKREGKELVALDLTTLAYRERREVSFPSLAALADRPLGDRIRAALELKDEVGEFLREHFVPALLYADALKEEISHSVEDFDRVMMWGFGWELGPFALIDAIDSPRLETPSRPYYRNGEMRAFTGEYVPRRREPRYRSAPDFPILEERTGFRVRDLGDGVKAVCLTTKMGVVTPELVRDLSAWLPGQQGPLVLTSEGRAFSVGYDLNFFKTCFEAERWEDILQGLTELQDLSDLLGTKAVVACVFGYTLGGGLELALGCPLVVAHPEAQIGFPEARVGLIPGGTGTVRMRMRAQSDSRQLVEMALHLTLGRTSTCAEEARELGFLRPHDVIGPHPDALLTLAKEKALAGVSPVAESWTPLSGPVAGMIDHALTEALAKGEITDYDKTIGEKIRLVFAKPTTRDEARAREREEFIDLLRRNFTQQRILHMLETGKPLRN